MTYTTQSDKIHAHGLSITIPPDYLTMNRFHRYRHEELESKLESAAEIERAQGVRIQELWESRQNWKLATFTSLGLAAILIVGDLMKWGRL